MLADRLSLLPEGSPVLYWRAAETRRAVLDADWEQTKSILHRVLTSYRSRSLLRSLISGHLAERGACSHMRTASGHHLGLIRPTIMIDCFEGDQPVLLAREDKSALRDAVVVADLDHARRVLRVWVEAGLTDARQWRVYIGERGESRARHYFLDALSHPDRSSAKTELELAVRIAIAEHRLARVA